MAVAHHYFALDGVFAGGTEAARGVEKTVVDPSLERVFEKNEDAALLLFGQTGTGKTHTLREALARCAALKPEQTTVRFVELAGRRACRDLLSNGKSVKLLADAEERVHFVGAAARTCADGVELARALDEGMSMRASVATERNEASSRSHAVVEISSAKGAKLTVVDLAGSERKWETMGLRGRAHQRESADINLSLMALKDCFRARHDGKRVPYRAATLTRVLRTCFEAAADSVAVVATLSPRTDDVIHSLYSLETVALMAPGLGASKRSSLQSSRLAWVDDASSGPSGDPMDWDAAATNRWLLTADRGRFAHVVIPEGTTGRELLTLSGAGLGRLFAGSGREGRGGDEGTGWTVEADGAGKRLAKVMVAALRREACKYRLG